MTPIQEKSLPHILSESDIIAQGKTGSGKTATFGLGLLNKLDVNVFHVQSLVLCPTRELADQVANEFRRLARAIPNVKVLTLCGGLPFGPQAASIANGVHIIIGTPGRVEDHLRKGTLRLKTLKTIVLDEADRMCDMGFIPDIRRIIKLLPTQRQTLCFAATMPEDIKRLTNKILTKPVRIQVGKMTPTKSVAHTLYPVPQALKKSLLFEMLKQTPTGRLLIFTRTKYRARNLARDLAKRGYRAQALQGNMSQNQRQRAIDGFRGNKYDILVATDVASRGIDVLDISHVINYDIPDSSETYTHRIGRTGRANKTGEAFTFASTEDTKLVREIEQALGSPIERRTLQDFKYGNFVPEKQFQGKYSKQKPSALSRRRRRKRRTRHKPKKTRTRH